MDYTLNIVSKCRFSLHLNILGLRKGPRKCFMGVLESPGFWVSKRVGTCTSCWTSCQNAVQCRLLLQHNTDVKVILLRQTNERTNEQRNETLHKHVLSTVRVLRPRECGTYYSDTVHHNSSALLKQTSSHRTLSVESS